MVSGGGERGGGDAGDDVRAGDGSGRLGEIDAPKFMVFMATIFCRILGLLRPFEVWVDVMGSIN